MQVQKNTDLSLMRAGEEEKLTDLYVNNTANLQEVNFIFFQNVLLSRSRFNLFYQITKYFFL